MMSDQKYAEIMAASEQRCAEIEELCNVWLNDKDKAVNGEDQGTEGTLRDKILEAAKVAIRCREGAQPVVEDWKMLGARNHEFIASVTTEDREFVVWVVVNVDTEEVYCL